MPELPEVETTRRALEPVMQGRFIRQVAVRHRGLRWPVPADLPARAEGARVRAVRRRAKYLLVETSRGTLLIHLGMSGSFRILRGPAEAGPHDHIDIVLSGGQVLRYTDPRRFGAFLWLEGEPGEHPLLRTLGPEPWDADLTADALHARARGRRTAIKSFLMDNHVIVGVGNIYANEALFRAGIRPTRPAGRVSLAAWEALLNAVREVLAEAIALGGTTLRDFTSGDGRPGYFRLQLAVYGRGGEPCAACGAPLREIRLGGRSTVYCPRCQS